MTVPRKDVAPIWRETRGEGPLVATAVHDGHRLRPDVAAAIALDDAERLREEDPFTGRWAEVAPSRVIGTHSRFQVDLNRPREKAVYRTPEDAWGLEVWKGDPPESLFERSLAEYDAFYAAMERLLGEVASRHGRFVVYDVHSYNHRRGGPDGPMADVAGNPQVNVGTGSVDRERWGPVVDAFTGALERHPFLGRHLDVRENVKFFGGNWPRWVHRTFPDNGLAIAIEFKKFFMDEWTGRPDEERIEAIGDALRATVGPVLDALAGSADR